MMIMMMMMLFWEKKNTLDRRCPTSDRRYDINVAIKRKGKKILLLAVGCI